MKPLPPLLSALALAAGLLTALPAHAVGGLVDVNVIDRDSGALTVTTPPAGLVSVGGYRFCIRDLQDLAARLEPGGTLYIGHSERVSGPGASLFETTGLTTYSVKGAVR